MIAVEIVGMPGKKHLRGVGAKEQRQYEHIKQSAERSGRYGDRLKKLQPGPCSGSIKQEVTARGGNTTASWRGGSPAVSGPGCHGGAFCSNTGGGSKVRSGEEVSRIRIATFLRKDSAGKEARALT